jgi:hypothetical protein
VLFFICPACEREQVYCGLLCRLLARLLQHRKANRIYQQSKKGRLKHAARQQAYRQRKVRALPQATVTEILVTDHTYEPSPVCATMAQPASLAENRPSVTIFLTAWRDQRSRTADRQVVVCHFCGRRGRFINPFQERK